MNRAKVPAALGVAGDLRGAERRTAGVNFFARTVILRRLEEEERSREERIGEDRSEFWEEISMLTEMRNAEEKCRI